MHNMNKDQQIIPQKVHKETELPELATISLFK